MASRASLSARSTASRARGPARHPVGGAWLTRHRSAPKEGDPAAPKAPSTVPGWLPGLDGLRAVAVLAVLLFHGDLGIFPGGFLGVDVFFVISGFLITTLLLREQAATGRIDLTTFWKRRARRLLPALFFLLAGVLVVTIVAVPETLVRLRVDILAAFAYVTNWYLIFDHQSYFEAVGRPSLLRHLWSLAVEEQFYLLWPIVLAVALTVVRRRGAIVLTVLIALASMAWTTALLDPDGDPSRVYYGTDTRLFTLLIGATLAFAWTAPRGPAVASLGRRFAAWRLPDVVSVAGLTVLAWAFLFVDQYDPALYPFGAAGLAVVAAATIAGAIQPSGWVGRRLLDTPVLRWIGRRSYAIYLWHWPVFTLTRPGQDIDLSPGVDFIVRVAITLALAELSWRLIEAPIRHGALSGLFRRWRQLGRRNAWARAGAVASAASIVIAVAAVSGRVMAVPPVATPIIIPGASLAGIVGVPTAGPSDVAIGSAAPAPVDPSEAASPDPGMASASPLVSAAPVPTDRWMPSGLTILSVVPTGSAPSGTPEPSAAPTTPAPTPAPIVTRPPATAPPLRADVYAIGDSVLLGAAAELGHALGRVEVDAEIGRQMSAALRILHDRASSGRLPAVVVVHLGNNGPVTTTQVQDLYDTLASVPHVVIVTIRIPDDFESHNNKLFTQLARAYPNVIVADWYAISNDRPGLFWKDGEHLRPEGADAYASMIAIALRNHGVTTR